MKKEWICCTCLQDESLFSQVDQEEGGCDYCNEESCVAALDSIIEEIRSIITTQYDNPENGLGWVDGEWVEGNGEVIDSYDLLTNEFDLGGSPAFDTIHAHFSDDQWCPKEFYSLNQKQIMQHTWSAFKNTIKHKRRYFFVNDSSELDDELDNRSPNSILKSIEVCINSIDMHSTVGIDTHLFRVRSITTNLFERNSADLGAPPNKYATQDNRMSPAGISMFYCSANEKTCALEAQSPTQYVLSIWQPVRPLQVVDFVTLFERRYDRIHFRHDSFMDRKYRNIHKEIQFICEFVKELSQPISPHQKIVDYIPTQVIAEYLRYEFKNDANENVDGIKFRSSIDGGINYCFFFGQEGCVPGDHQQVSLVQYSDRLVAL